MEFRQNDFFTYPFHDQFAGIVTDVPYTGCIRNQLHEQDFDVAEFLEKADTITPPDSFLITFSNMAMIQDMREFAKNTSWKFQTYQIWNKEPCRTWIAWSKPLRTCEFVLYFTKGNYKLCFKTGKEKPMVKRGSFGGKLKATTANDRKCSYEMYSEIVTFPSPKHKIHPTQKPEAFSEMFRIVVGDPKGCILDPFCGSGNLLSAFPNSIGMDVKDYLHATSQTLIPFMKGVKAK